MRKRLEMKKYNIELDKETIKALMFAGNNYKNRILYLERENKISKSKLNYIKQTTLFNLIKGIDLLGYQLCPKCKGTGIYEGKICLDCGGI